MQADPRCILGPRLAPDGATRRRISFCPHGLYQLIQRACALNGGGEPVLQALGCARTARETRRIQPAGGTAPQYRTAPVQNVAGSPVYTAAGRLSGTWRREPLPLPQSARVVEAGASPRARIQGGIGLRPAEAAQAIACAGEQGPQSTPRMSLGARSTGLLFLITGLPLPPAGRGAAGPRPVARAALLESPGFPAALRFGDIPSRRVSVPKHRASTQPSALSSATLPLQSPLATA